MLTLACLGGCVLGPQAKKGRSPLKAAQMSPDSVSLEIFFVRFPLGDPEANGRLWEETDEQHFPPELRRRLAKNGFRAGLIGGQVPASLAKLMELKETAPADGGLQQTKVTELQAKPRVMQRHLQMRAGRRSEIIASGIYERLPLLVSEGGELHGQTYLQAQGIFAAKATPEADGRVRLELVPEVQHGHARQRWVGDQTMMWLEAGRPKRAMDELRISAVLKPGNMLLLTSLPDRPGSLGHYFFTEGEGKLEQKLLVLRLCQTQHDDLNPPPLALEEP